MSFTFEIEGLNELKLAWATGQSELESDLNADSVAAAQDGIDEAKSDHPYTDRTGDLTGNAHVEYGDTAMVWPEGYATFVNDGTSRSKPYPYTPQAVTKAEKSLEIRATFSAEALAEKMNR